MQVECRWCHQLVDAPPRDVGFPKPFIVNGVAHYYSHMRGTPTKVKSPVVTEQPPMILWSDVEKKAAAFWQARRPTVSNTPEEIVI